MIVNGSQLYKALDRLLLPNGFVKRGDTYYYCTSECICFFSIGKSPYGGQYDHVMGCFLKKINEEKGPFPKFNKSHLQYSLREMTDKELVKNVFDLEANIYNGNERELLIADLLMNYVIPFIKDVGSEKGIKIAINKYSGLKNRVKAKLWDYLELQD